MVYLSVHLIDVTKIAGLVVGCIQLKDTLIGSNHIKK